MTTATKTRTHRGSAHRLLTAREEVELTRRAHAGDTRARDRLVERNIGLVRSIAGKHLGGGLDFDDLAQEGTIGLMRAVDKFDPELGYRFSTYATHWIKQAIRRALDDRGQMVRLPVHRAEIVRRILRTRSELEAREGREVEPWEIAVEIGRDVEDVELALRESRKTGSLNARMQSAGGSGSELGDLVSDAGDEPLVDTALREIETGNIREALDCLLEQERHVLERRYGLYGAEASVSQVARELGLDREQVQRLQRRAERTLRDYHS